MSNRNEDRTLSGSTELYCDILDLPSTINAIRIRNVFGTAGQVLAKNPTTNKIEWSVVPIADDTITTNMIQDLAVTDAKIANNTITGGKLANNININTTGALTIGGITTLKGLILFYNGETPVGTFVPSTGVLSLPTGDFESLFIGSGGELVVSAGNATFGADTVFGGELSMSAGGAEVFNMNNHNLTNGGDATFNSLTLSTALNMLNINLDLGSGNLTANNIDGDAITGNSLSIDGGTTIIDDTGISLKLTAGGASTISLPHATGLISCLGLNTNNNVIQTGGGGVETSGGYLDTDGGNLSMNNGDIIGANDIQCVNLDAGTIEGSTNLNGIMNVGYGAIDSVTNNGQITGYGGSLIIRLDTGEIGCKTINTQNEDIIMGTGQISSVDNIFGTGLFRANELQLNSTGLGINTTNVVYPDTADIRGYNLYNSTNDIPRILACKSFFADYNYTRSISTTYTNIDKDTTTLNVAFAVPSSCKILVEVGFYLGATLGNERLMMKLVNSAGTEFYTAYINDTAHGHSTENMECQYASLYGTRGQTIITKWFLSFPTSQRNVSVNLQPQVKLASGSCSITTGGSATAQTPPMYVKVESLGSTSAFNWHYELSGGGGGDDY